MKYFDKWAGNFILALHVFLLFLIFASEKVELPVLLAWSGRLHPLLLHLPIGFFSFASLLWIIRRQIQGQQALQLSLLLSALSIPLTAVTGFFISRDGGYDDTLLFRHQWSAVVFGLLAWALYTGVRDFPGKTHWWNPLFALTFSGMLLTGHWGGQLTHGTDFLDWPESAEEALANTPAKASASTTFYAAAVQPVFSGKCVTCHRTGKTKGGLNLENTASAIKGGESGPIWLAGDVAGSIFLQRIHLPVTDKKHMPPRGKNPLTPEEEALLDSWVAAGADTRLKIAEIKNGHPLFRFVSQKSVETPVTYRFKPASNAVLAKLNDAYTTVKPIATGSPALEATIFIRKAFNIKRVTALQKVKDQLVRLNLNNMPVRDQDLDALLPFSNLEQLTLSYTDISGKGLEKLKQLPALRSISLTGTNTGVNAAAALTQIPKLKTVYLWNTRVSAKEIEQLKRKYPNIQWEFGFTPSPKDILALSPPLFEKAKPILAERDSIFLKTAIPGSVIKYTTDGTLPDSINGLIYKTPIPFRDIVTVKARAFKAGWLNSEVSEMTVYKQGKRPARLELLTAPNPEYTAKPEVLLNGELGNITQFRSGQWLGYKDRHLEAIFYFDKNKAPDIKSLAVSYGVNIGSYIVPPVSMEVWGGKNPKEMELLAKASFDAFSVQDLADQESRGRVLKFKSAAQWSYYKLVVRNLTQLPDFHPGKGTPGWFFVDEVFFN